MTPSRTRPLRLARRTATAVALTALAAGALVPGALAAAPGSPTGTAATGTLTGTLVRAYVEVGPRDKGSADAAHTTSPGADQLTWVRTSSGHQERVPSSQVADVPAGSQVRLTVGSRRPGADDVPSAGREVLSTTVTSTPPTAAPAAAAARTARATAAATTPAVQQLTVVQALPVVAAGSSTRFTADATTTAAFAAQVAKASAFWSTQTGGRVTLKVVASLPWTPLTSSCSDPDALWAEAARKAGWTEGVGKHLVVELPEAADAGGCGAGLGTVGRYLGDGGTLWTSYSDWAVVAHELGHNFSLGHANALACGTAPDRLTSCTEQGYLDSYDVMGISWWNTGSLSTSHLDELGLMSATTQHDVSAVASAAADLRPVGGHTGLQSLTFVDGGIRYWVEYRGPVGYDTWTTRSSYADAQYNDGYTAGVLVRRVGSTTDQASAYYGSRVLLRPHGVPASTTSAPEWTLTAGQSMQTAGHRLIRVTSVGSVAHVLVEKASLPLTSVRTTARTSGQTLGGVAYHRSASLTMTFAASPRTPAKGYQVLVDGAVKATAGPTARSATLTGLASGRHVLAVRALDGSRTVTSPTTTVRVDRTAPTFSTAPTLRLRPGAQVGADVPVVLRFAAADAVGLSRLTSTAPGLALPTSSRSLVLTQRSGTTVTRSITAADAAGNTSTLAARTAALLASERWSTGYAGRWATVRGADYLGLAAQRSLTRGAAAVLTATGRDIGLVATTGPTQGRVTVYVDGGHATTVDLRAATTSTRRLVWGRHFTRTARHTVKVVVQGTAGRPWVSLDGWAVLG